MKTRSGFVSNSSSSSFIIALPHMPEDVKELQNWLFFEDTEVFVGPYEGDWPVAVVTERVFNDLKDLKALTKKQMIDSLCDGWFDTMFKIDEFYEGADHRLNLKKWDKYKREEATEIVNQFIKSHSKMKFFIVNYEDGNGAFESALEHGDLFERVPHLVISHH